jgi:hypothetical protein
LRHSQSDFPTPCASRADAVEEGFLDFRVTKQDFLGPNFAAFDVDSVDKERLFRLGFLTGFGRLLVCGCLDNSRLGAGRFCFNGLGR